MVHLQFIIKVLSAEIGVMFSSSPTRAREPHSSSLPLSTAIISLKHANICLLIETS